jgi:hypothetical protein
MNCMLWNWKKKPYILKIVREQYKSYFGVSLNNLSFWVDMVLWHGIRAWWSNDHEFESHHLLSNQYKKIKHMVVCESL